MIFMFRISMGNNLSVAVLTFHIGFSLSIRFLLMSICIPYAGCMCRSTLDFHNYY